MMNFLSASCVQILWNNGQGAPNESRTRKEHSQHHKHHIGEPFPSGQWHPKNSSCAHDCDHLPQPALPNQQKSGAGMSLLFVTTLGLLANTHRLKEIRLNTTEKMNVIITLKG